MKPKKYPSNCKLQWTNFFMCLAWLQSTEWDGTAAAEKNLSLDSYGYENELRALYFFSLFSLWIFSIYTVFFFAIVHPPQCPSLFLAMSFKTKPIQSQVWPEIIYNFFLAVVSCLRMTTTSTTTTTTFLCWIKAL